METATIVAIALIGYKLLLIGVGAWASRMNHTGEDFFLGGRQLGPWVAGISYSASASSAWTLLGLSGAAYTLGVSGFVEGLLASATVEQLSFTGANMGLMGLGVIFGGLSIGFGTYGQPHLIVRFMALRDDSARRQAAIITAFWYVIVFLGMVFLGLAGRILFADLDNPEQVFFKVADSVFPALIAGLLTAAVLSAIMSTADSQLLVSASVLSHDLKLEQKFTSRLLLGRLAVLVVVALAAAVALFLPAQIFARVLFAWVALGAAFGPLLFARLWKWNVAPSKQLLGVWLGFGLAVLFSYLPNTTGDIAERLLPFITHFAFLYIVRKPK